MKKKICSLLLAAASVVAGVFAVSISSSAAPVILPDGSVFDAEYYAEKYSDVQAVFGNDFLALYNHYVLFGKNEGRKTVDVPDGFDSGYYASTYPDAGLAYGSDAEGLFKHYVVFGFNEGRNANANKTPVIAAAAQPILATAPVLTNIPATVPADSTSSVPVAVPAESTPSVSVVVPSDNASNAGELLTASNLGVLAKKLGLTFDAEAGSYRYHTGNDWMDIYSWNVNLIDEGTGCLLAFEFPGSSTWYDYGYNIYTMDAAYGDMSAIIAAVRAAY